MARIELAAQVDEDFERILRHLVEHDVPDAASRILQIASAIDVLESNPLIGRSTREGLRELIIGRRTGGYVALYRYVPEVETVFVLAIRGQREAGYTST